MRLDRVNSLPHKSDTVPTQDNTINTEGKGNAFAPPPPPPPPPSKQRSSEGIAQIIMMMMMTMTIPHKVVEPVKGGVVECATTLEGGQQRLVLNDFSVQRGTHGMYSDKTLWDC